MLQPVWKVDAISTAFSRRASRRSRENASRPKEGAKTRGRSRIITQAAALSAFLGRPGLAAIAAWFGEAGDERNASAVATAGEEVDCVSRIKPWLPKLRDYAAWLHGGHTPSDPGCDEDVAPITRLCGNGTADDRACAEAWLDRARRCAERLRDKHHLSTVPAARPLARCVDGASSR